MVWLKQHQAQQYLRLTDNANFNLVRGYERLQFQLVANTCCPLQEPYLTSGPSLVLAVQRDNGVIVFDALLGSSFDKDSLLNKYGSQILRPKNVASVSRVCW